MKPYIEVRGIKIGENPPKICVPIVGRTKEEILAAAVSIQSAAPDIVEWRADWYEDVSDFSRVSEVLTELRTLLPDMPLLFTFRTRAEGGEKSIPLEAYAKLTRQAAASSLVDLVDVEASAGDETVRDLIRKAHSCDVKVIVSSHDFQKTPGRKELIGRLVHMQNLGADIPKIAVMPHSRKDVLTLLDATREMWEEHADRPIITMSMGAYGRISRVCGEFSGSALTFGAVGKASAPGQMNAADLRTVLKLLHQDPLN
ncbi:MAG: type I 3-dehydroquinate dehydratase [Clostridiales bacterium]|nr:type I 3-dehydroquinate dehydratase [Clostridiales bacterium]